jgi:predicted nucleic acid-binding protein
MNIVDSSGWVEYFADESNADFFKKSIRDTENLLVPSICGYEVFKRMLRERGEDEALRAIGIMSLGIEAVLDRVTAVAAAQISTEYKLAMADSIIYATAQMHNATLWTQDEHFKGLSGVEYIEKTRP